MSLDLKDLEAAQTAWRRVGRKRDRWVSVLEDARQACDRNDRLHRALEGVLVVAEAAGEARALSERASRLSGVIKESKRLAKCAAIRVPNLEQLERSYNEAEELRERRDELAEALERVGSSLSSSERLNREWNKARADLEQRCEGVCPLCGGAMK